MRAQVCVCDQFVFEEQKVSFRHVHRPRDEPFERTDLHVLASGNLLVSAHVSSRSETCNRPRCGKVQPCGGRHSCREVAPVALPDLAQIQLGNRTR